MTDHELNKLVLKPYKAQRQDLTDQELNRLIIKPFSKVVEVRTRFGTTVPQAWWYDQYNWAWCLEQSDESIQAMYDVLDGDLYVISNLIYKDSELLLVTIDCRLRNMVIHLVECKFDRCYAKLALDETLIS